MRLVRPSEADAEEPCSCCRAVGARWDWLGEVLVCGECQERLVSGEGPAVSMRARQAFCAVCGRQGTVPYRTWPLHEAETLEIDLCPHHLRALLGRRLTASAYHLLRRQLNLMGLAAEQLFLLHESFYDEEGGALRPVSDAD